MGFLCFQIDKIPDLSLNKYQSLAETGVDGVLKRHENFLRQWHGICTESNSSFHLLYCYLPSEPTGQRLKVFFLIQGEASDLKLVEPLLLKSPLSDFFFFHKSDLPQICIQAGATLVKKERLADIYNPVSDQNKLVHYVPKWEMNEEGRLYDLFRIMQTVSQSYTPSAACAYRIDLYPTAAEQETRSKFAPVLKELRGETDIKLLRDTDSIRSNTYARNVCDEYDNWISSVETNPHFRANVYGFADNVFLAKVILNAAGSESIAQGDFAIAPIKPDDSGEFNLLSRMGEKAESYCFYPSHSVLPSWSTTLCLFEVAPFFRFPSLFDGEVIEIPKETAPIQIENGILFGYDMNGYPVKYGLSDFSRHAFFTGMPGSGKTNTMLHLAAQFHNRGIPFLALEPAKKEYRELLSHDEMQNVYLFSPHLQSRFPLYMNPMAFPVGVRLSEHINALLEVFEGSFVLEGPTYKFLSSAIQKSYADLGWDIEEINTGDKSLLFPTLQDVYDNLEQEINASTYDSELKGNIRSFLQVRLGGLMERDAGELFNVRLSSIRPGDWINISAIVELEVLGEQAKNFFVLLVCHYILETLRANPTSRVDSNGELMPVRHVIFIEEAHNIIAQTSQQMSSESVNPKISATSYIVKMLAEVRALRESIIIADQLPTALASEVTKNTGLKIVHRLTAKDDREQIGRAISASAMQLEAMASFSAGRAFIYHEKTMKPFEIQVEKWDAPTALFDWSNDLQLYSRIYTMQTMGSAIKTAVNNWKIKYLVPVDNDLFELQRRCNEEDLTDIKNQFFFSSRKDLLIAECEQLKVKFRRLSNLWLLDREDHPINYQIEKTLKYIDGMILRLHSTEI